METKQSRSREFYNEVWSVQRGGIGAEEAVTYNPMSTTNLTYLLTGRVVIAEARALVHGKVCLDLCCGMGRMSYAMVQLGASRVYGVDGSDVGPRTAELSIADSRFVPVTCNAADFRDAIPEPIDLAICYYALMHVEDPESVVRNLAQSAFRVSVNFFTAPAVLDLDRELRRIFRDVPLEVTSRMCRRLGKHNHRQEVSLVDLILEEDPEGLSPETKGALVGLIREHGPEKVLSRIHLETLQCPVLEPLDPDRVCSWFTDAGSQVVDSWGEGTQHYITAVRTTDATHS